MTQRQQLTVRAIVDAPLAHVWQVWTNPDDIMKWNAASDDWHTTKSTNDLKTGGQFSSTMAAKDGSASFDFAGVYDRVEPESLIEYTIGDGRKVRIDFKADGDKTEIVEVFEAEGTHPPEFQQKGWQSIMDNFKKHAEATRP